VRIGQPAAHQGKSRQHTEQERAPAKHSLTGTGRTGWAASARLAGRIASFCRHVPPSFAGTRPSVKPQGWPGTSGEAVLHCNTRSLRSSPDQCNLFAWVRAKVAGALRWTTPGGIGAVAGPREGTDNSLYSVVGESLFSACVRDWIRKQGGRFSAR
jgi:hypothetical protein